MQTQYVDLIQPVCKHVQEFLCVSLLAKVLPLVSFFDDFLFFINCCSERVGFEANDG